MIFFTTEPLLFSCPKSICGFTLPLQASAKHSDEHWRPLTAQSWLCQHCLKFLPHASRAAGELSYSVCLLSVYASHLHPVCFLSTDTLPKTIVSSQKSINFPSSLLFIHSFTLNPPMCLLAYLSYHKLHGSLEAWEGVLAFLNSLTSSMKAAWWVYSLRIFC